MNPSSTHVVRSGSHRASIASARSSARRRRSSSPVTPASSRAFHATSAEKPADPMANSGLCSGAPDVDRSIVATSSPLRRYQPSGVRRFEQGVVPPRAVVAPRLPRVAHLHEPVGRPPPALEQEPQPLGRPVDVPLVHRHPPSRELRHGVPVHRRLRDRGGLVAAPQPGVRVRAARVPQVRDEPVVVLGGERRVRARPPPGRSPRCAHTTAWKQLSHSHCHGYVVGLGTQNPRSPSVRHAASRTRRACEASVGGRGYRSADARRRLRVVPARTSRRGVGGGRDVGAGASRTRVDGRARWPATVRSTTCSPGSQWAPPTPPAAGGASRRRWPTPTSWWWRTCARSR